jgi:sugar lactone lactonase YvrE
VRGGAGSPATASSPPRGPVPQPNDATYDDDGNLYIVDQQNQRIRRIDPTGSSPRSPAPARPATSGDGGPALEAEFSWAAGSNPNPSGGIVHHQGKLYVSDTEPTSSA